MTHEQLEKIEGAATEALREFWRTVAQIFPEITSGDLDPLADHMFTEHAKHIIAKWIESNTEGHVG